MNWRNGRIVCLALVGLLGLMESRLWARGPSAEFGFVSPLVGSSTTIPPSYEALLYFIDSPDSDIVSVDMWTGSNGITGRFVQRWTSSAGNGVYDLISPSGGERDLVASDWNFDSHILTNPGTTVVYASEGLGTNPTTPGPGQPFGPFPVNTLSVGYSQTGTDGYLKGLIQVNQPGVRYLEVAYAVDAFFDVWYAELNADVTTTSGTTHTYTRYIPEPGALLTALTSVFVFWQRVHPRRHRPRRAAAPGR